MLFNSYEFIFFMLPISVAGYYLLNRIGNKAGIIYLLLCSMFFVGYMNPAYLLVLIPSILINYAICYLMNSRYKSKQKVRRFLMLLGICIDVGLLAYFKYADFFIKNMNRLMSKDHAMIEVIVPLGISFYTFQQISFLIDSYRDEKLKCGLDEYALFISFYPQFVQGPIVLQDEFIPQIRDNKKKSVNYEKMSKGLYRFILGLAKKVLIADSIAMFVDAGYEKHGEVGSLLAVALIVGYSLQIYFDFSAYSDMAVGLGLIFNIDLPENFDSPYKANNIDEFWDRWHITLTRFLTRYLYFPLGGSKKGKARTYINIMLVFLISGLWHGAEWSFVVWGAVHGIAKVIRRACKDLGHKEARFRYFGRIITFVFVSLAWVFFRAPNNKEAFAILSGVFRGGWNYIAGDLYESFSKLVEISWILRLDVLNVRDHIHGLVVIIVLLFMIIMCFGAKNSKEMVSKWNDKPKTIYAIIMGVLFAWCLLSFNGVTNYIYWSF